MKIDIQRYVPMDMDGAQESTILLWALGGGSVWSSLAFLSTYMQAYDNLFHHQGAFRSSLRTGAMMPGFFELLSGSELLFMILCAIMPFWAIYHYRLHFGTSKSIYLMSRLPDRWDLHRRCLTFPVVGFVSALSLQGLLGCIYWLIYIFVTPRQCLPM